MQFLIICLMIHLLLIRFRRSLLIQVTPKLLSQHPVIPVVTLNRVADALPLAETLLENGVAIMEVTLRTDAGLAAIESIVRHLPDMIVGGGTVRRIDDLSVLSQAGAQFAVCPGTTPSLLESASQLAIPFLPAAATPSEMMLLLSKGYAVQKFFPAAHLGGLNVIRALRGPLPDISLCPSGGIGMDNCCEYLAEPNVLSVSGSWMAPTPAIDAGDWQQVAQLVKETLRRVGHMRAHQLSEGKTVD